MRRALTSGAMLTLFCGPWMVGLSYAADSLISTARQQFDLGRYEAAATLLESGLAKSPQDGLLAFWAARCYFELGNFDRALDYGQRAVDSDPNNSEYHHWLGKEHGMKADQARSFGSALKCREEFEAAVRLNGANISARRDLLEFYVEAPGIVGGGKDKAWQQATAISDLDPVAGALARGFYWATLGDSERAEAEYKRVLELKPGRIDPYFEVAEFYQGRSDAPHMQAVLEAASSLEPQDSRWAYYRGVAGILARKGLKEAEQELRTYLASPPRRDFPSHAAAREWLGRLYEESGQSQLAIEEYKAALQLEPRRKSAGEGLKRLGKTP